MKTKLIALLAALAMAARRAFGRPAYRASFGAVNALDVGTHGKGRITRYADALFSTRYLLVKQGVAANTVALCTANDQPLGIATDYPSVAGTSGDPIAVQTLPGVGTIRMVASGAITQGAQLQPAAAGQVQPLITTGGSGAKWVIGVALQAAQVAGDVIEVQPSFFLSTPY